jgi:hypothetical protein
VNGRAQRSHRPRVDILPRPSDSYAVFDDLDLSEDVRTFAQGPIYGVAQDMGCKVDIGTSPIVSDHGEAIEAE